MRIQDFIERQNNRPRSSCRTRYQLTLDALDANIDPDENLERREDFLRVASSILSNNLTAMRNARLLFENYDFERSLEAASPGVITGEFASTKQKKKSNG